MEPVPSRIPCPECTVYQSCVYFHLTSLQSYFVRQFVKEKRLSNIIKSFFVIVTVFFAPTEAQERLICVVFVHSSRPDLCICSYAAINLHLSGPGHQAALFALS